jgi:hypothetical protein
MVVRTGDKPHAFTSCMLERAFAYTASLSAASSADMDDETATLEGGRSDLQAQTHNEFFSLTRVTRFVSPDRGARRGEKVRPS